MIKNKFGQQLSLFLNESKTTSNELAAAIPVSKGQFSNMKAGRRPFTKQAMKEITDIAHDFNTKLSAARETYGTLSFVRRPSRTDDFLGAIVEQQKEEGERLGIQQKFMDAATTPERYRSQEQRNIIDQFMSELSEEVGSEFTLLGAAAKYLDLDAQDYVDLVNSKYGG